jgi:hypothetical protein
MNKEITNTLAPFEVLEERLSDILLNQQQSQDARRKLNLLYDIALKTVYECALAGNVRCTAAIVEMQEVLK